jgi:hypothetical protein
MSWAGDAGYRPQPNPPNVCGDDSHFNECYSMPASYARFRVYRLQLQIDHNLHTTPEQILCLTP